MEFSRQVAVKPNVKIVHQTNKLIQHQRERKHKKNAAVVLVRLLSWVTFNAEVHPSTTLDSIPHKQMAEFRRSGFVKQVLGTSEPTIKLRSGITSLISTGGGALPNVIACDVSGSNDWTSWKTIFDQFQLIGCRFFLCPIQAASEALVAAGTVNILTPLVVVVDYDDSTALPSFSDGLAYDTHKIFFLTKNNPEVFSIAVHPQGQPDLVWQDTLTPTNLEWIKMYLLRTTAISADMGSYWFEFDVKFRQIVSR